MKIIIWFSWLRRIAMVFPNWNFDDAEEYVSRLKETEFLKFQSRGGKLKYYPTSEIKAVKIK